MDSEALPVKKRTVFLNKMLSHHKKESVLAAFSDAWHPFWLLNNVQKEPTSRWLYNLYVHIPLEVVILRSLFEGLEEASCKPELP